MAGPKMRSIGSRTSMSPKDGTASPTSLDAGKYANGGRVAAKTGRSPMAAGTPGFRKPSGGKTISAFGASQTTGPEQYQSKPPASAGKTGASFKQPVRVGGGTPKAKGSPSATGFTPPLSFKNGGKVRGNDHDADDK